MSAEGGFVAVHKEALTEALGYMAEVGGHLIELAHLIADSAGIELDTQAGSDAE